MVNVTSKPPRLYRKKSTTADGVLARILGCSPPHYSQCSSRGRRLSALVHAVDHAAKGASLLLVLAPDQSVAPTDADARRSSRHAPIPPRWEGDRCGRTIGRQTVGVADRMPDGLLSLACREDRQRGNCTSLLTWVAYPHLCTSGCRHQHDCRIPALFTRISIAPISLTTRGISR
jgi:hypothetical protein